MTASLRRRPRTWLLSPPTGHIGMAAMMMGGGSLAVEEECFEAGAATPPITRQQQQELMNNVEQPQEWKQQKNKTE